MLPQIMTLEKKNENILQQHERFKEDLVSFPQNVVRSNKQEDYQSLDKYTLTK